MSAESAAPDAAPQGTLSLARDRRAERAFERLYRRHVADVYRYALAVMRNPADAEDLTQTTFLNAYRAFRRGERPHTPYNWLIRIAHNAATQRHRERTRRPEEVPLDEGASAAATARDEDSGLEEALRALGRLTLNQRAALVMREVEGRSYREIAEALGVSEAAVDMQIYRARKAVRAHRAAMRAVKAAPVPTSLASFFGGGAAVKGVALVGGGGFAAKALALLTAGVVAGGAGLETVFARPAGAGPPTPRTMLADTAAPAAPAVQLMVVQSPPRAVEPAPEPEPAPAAPMPVIVKPLDPGSEAGDPDAVATTPAASGPARAARPKPSAPPAPAPAPPERRPTAIPRPPAPPVRLPPLQLPLPKPEPPALPVAPAPPSLPAPPPALPPLAPPPLPPVTPPLPPLGG
jgi:RNA polymerase sigma factor (sigma-70 family)